MSAHRSPRLTSAVCSLLAFLAIECVHADVLDPLDFTSLGTLNLTGGNFTIDTDALTIVDDAVPGTPLFIGVADDQNGTADYLNNVWVPGSMGIPEIAVFTFDDINLQSTANITVVGTRALALLSQGGATINTTIDVSGESVGPVGDPAGVGRAGGFSGGEGDQAPGDGPGGGRTENVATVGGSGGFGGPGVGTAGFGPHGQPYGDLALGPLQGGSGGSSTDAQLIPGPANGAAGGGALEISAKGGVTLGSSGDLIATGGLSRESTFVFDFAGGVGSGGGIRIQGLSVDLVGSVDASASFVNSSNNIIPGTTAGGGGRVAVFGLNQLFDFVIGVTDPSSIDTSMINVEGGGGAAFGSAAGTFTRGLISVSPQMTTIPSGQPLTLGQITDLSDDDRRLELLHHNIRVQQGGQAVVPAEGYVNSGKIELFPGGSRITGAGTLENRNELSGQGTVEVPLVNGAGGSIDAINDVLTFTASVTNDTGGEINAIDSTLDFDAGLTNAGELNLINSTVNGTIASNASIASAGSNTFTGDVSGAGNFTGNGEVVFTGSYSPGNSPASVSFGGDVTLTSTNTLVVELASDGGLPGTDFDQLAVAGNATLAGAIDVSLINPFMLSPGLSFEILDVDGALSGTFSGLGEGSLVGNFGGVNLLITYAGGDGNDVTLLSAMPGDFDIDSDVDAIDFLKWQRGESPRPFTAADLDDWEANYGANPGALAAVSVPVPEPVTGLLAGVGLVALISAAGRRGRLPGRPRRHNRRKRERFRRLRSPRRRSWSPAADACAATCRLRRDRALRRKCRSR